MALPFDIELAPKLDSKTFFFALIGVAVSIVFLLSLLLLIGCACCCKKKKIEEYSPAPKTDRHQRYEKLATVSSVDPRYKTLRLSDDSFRASERTFLTSAANIPVTTNPTKTTPSSPKGRDTIRQITDSRRQGTLNPVDKSIPMHKGKPRSPNAFVKDFQSRGQTGAETDATRAALRKLLTMYATKSPQEERVLRQREAQEQRERDRQWRLKHRKERKSKEKKPITEQEPQTRPSPFTDAPLLSRQPQREQGYRKIKGYPKIKIPQENRSLSGDCADRSDATTLYLKKEPDASRGTTLSGESNKPSSQRPVHMDERRRAAMVQHRSLSKERFPVRQPEPRFVQSRPIQRASQNQGTGTTQDAVGAKSRTIKSVRGQIPKETYQRSRLL